MYLLMIYGIPLRPYIIYLFRYIVKCTQRSPYFVKSIVYFAEILRKTVFIDKHFSVLAVSGANV